jgi:hypothetical protein
MEGSGKLEVIANKIEFGCNVQLRTTKVNKFIDRFIETGRDFLKVRKPSE